jgi:glycine cleavage system regulatory protein
MGRPALGDSAAPAGGAGGSLAVNGGAAGKQIDTLHRGYVALGFPAAERDKDADHYFKPADVSRRTQDESGGRNASPSGGDGLLKLTADPQVTTAGKEVKVVFTDGSNGAPPAPPAAQPAEPAKPGQQAQEKPEEPKAEPTLNTPPTTAQIFQRKIIRNGTMEFEVEGFDAAYMQVTKIVAEEGGFIATTNSEKLPNGKVKGTVILRVPPDHLDVLVLKLRALGDLRGQRISAEDITKQYTDLESELRADRAMESRLLDIIKNGKGTIKDLVEAEKQLGVWREKIEKIEGELRYYNNLVSLSTLSITLYERDIKTPTAAYETEQVNIGVETEDVEKSRADALTAIENAKGRVIESKLEQHEAGQYSANIVADVAPDQAGPVIDRLKQLGRVARLDVDRRQTTAGGTGAPQGIKVERRDTRLAISLYNLANVAPRLSTNAAVAAEDVEAAYRTILAAVEKAGGRVVSSNLNRQRADQVSGTINAEVKSDQAATIEAELRKAGEVMHLSVAENPDTQNVTRTKQGFVIQLDSLAQVPARETVTTQIAATDVAQAFSKIADAVHTAGGRVLTSQLNEQDSSNVAATFTFEIKRDAKPAVDKAMADAGDAISRSVQRSQDVQNTVDNKVLVQLTLSSAEQLPPRQTTVLGLRVSDVTKSMAAIASLGAVKDSGSSTQSNGRVIAKVVIDVPLDKAFETRTKIADMGHVLMEQDSRDTRLPQGRLAKARFDVTLSNEEMIVARDEGLWSAVKRGLSASVTGLLWSLQLVVVGLCFVLPWALIAYGLWKWVRRSRTIKPAVA